METNRVKQFCVIAEIGSLTKSAKLLHITHSALSKSMKLLQEELGLALLQPAGRGIALTNSGKLFYQRAKEFLEQEDRLFKFEKSSSQSTIKIGAVEIFLSTMANQLNSPFFQNFNVTLLDSDPGKMEQEIVSNQLDFGITYVPFPMQNIEITEIGKYQLRCYHLQGKFKGKTITQIPFVVPAQNLAANPLNIKERDGWIDSIHPRNKKYYVNLLSTAIELTLQGLCAIYIPDFVAKKINASRKATSTLVEYPLPKINKNQQLVFLLRHCERTEDEIYRQIFQMIKRLINVSS